MGLLKNIHFIKYHDWGPLLIVLMYLQLLVATPAVGFGLCAAPWCSVSGQECKRGRIYAAATCNLQPEFPQADVYANKTLQAALLSLPEIVSAGDACLFFFFRHVLSLFHRLNERRRSHPS